MPRELFLEYGIAPPSPEGTPWISVCIDDLVILDEVAEDALDKPGRDTVVYNKACQVYEENGLAPKPEKKQERVVDGKGLGADILGSDGYVGAPRKNLAQLMCL